MPETIYTSQAPNPIGPYSQAVAAPPFLFVSGQIAIDPATGSLVEGGIEAQSIQVMKNLEAILEKAGSAFPNLVKCEVFLTDISNFPVFNEVYAKALGDAVRPARQVVEVSALPMGALVEVSCIALLP